jgi:hypothetical protein
MSPVGSASERPMPPHRDLMISAAMDDRDLFQGSSAAGKRSAVANTGRAARRCR